MSPHSLYREPQCLTRAFRIVMFLWFSRCLKVSHYNTQHHTFMWKTERVFLYRSQYRELWRQNFLVYICKKIILPEYASNKQSDTPCNQWLCDIDEVFGPNLASYCMWAYIFASADCHWSRTRALGNIHGFPHTCQWWSPASSLCLCLTLEKKEKQEKESTFANLPNKYKET